MPGLVPRRPQAEVLRFRRPEEGPALGPNRFTVNAQSRDSVRSSVRDGPKKWTVVY